MNLLTKNRTRPLFHIFLPLNYERATLCEISDAKLIWKRVGQKSNSKNLKINKEVSGEIRKGEGR